jgi:CheY-like chemotaxis protein
MFSRASLRYEERQVRAEYSLFPGIECDASKSYYGQLPLVEVSASFQKENAVGIFTIAFVVKILLCGIVDILSSHTSQVDAAAKQYNECVPIRDDILRRSRILIIDDEEVNVRLLKRILEHGGFTDLTSTTDSRKAVTLFQHVRPDLILTDWLMPHLDGYALVAQLRELIPPGDYLPIVVLTADATPQAKRQALTIGATDFLTKPIDALEVNLRVGNLLTTRWSHLKMREQNAVLEETVRIRTCHVEKMLAELRQSSMMFWIFRKSKPENLCLSFSTSILSKPLKRPWTC